jgi:hypothetical protein
VRRRVRQIEVNGCEITAGVGAKLKQVAYAGVRANLGGLEWMEGIPGAVGGGLRMNAGAMGAQTFENVVRVRYLDAEGDAHDKERRRSWKCITGMFRRWRKLCGLGRFPGRRRARKKSSAWKRRRRNGARRSRREKRRLHFQESGFDARRKTGGRAWG